MTRTWCQWVVGSLAAAVLAGACSGGEELPGTGLGGKASTGGEGGDATSNNSLAGEPARQEGGERQACYPNDTCNAGLECIDQACVVTGRGGMGGSGGSGGTTAGTSAGQAGESPSPIGGTTSAVGGGGAGPGGSDGGAAGIAAAGMSGASYAGEADGGAGGAPSTPWWKSAGCGKDPMQATATLVKYTMQTSGVKDANCADHLLDGTPVCGPWSIQRDYYVWLPPSYDPSKTYPLVIQGTGCGGNGTQIYSLSPTGMTVNDGVNGSVIRVGLAPPPASVGNGTNPGQGCYDDKEGDDSVEFVFYEKLMDVLAASLCIDKSAVFASGNSSGGWLANELGCKYAGDAKYPIRGVLVNTGGLPSQPAWEPTCTTSPMAGMWIHEVNDPENPFANNKFAITRAMQVNGCAIGTSFDTAQFDNYPIGGGNADSTCQKIKGCPAANPLVVCALPGNQHAPHDSIANPGFATFLTQLEGL